MAKFTDAKERTWEIPHFDPLNIADVQQELGVSLYTLTAVVGEGDAREMRNLRQLYENVPVFWNVVYLLVKDQARERQVDERGFMLGMVGGDALEAAQKAFFDEVIFFSPKRLRDLLTRLNQEWEKQVTAMLEITDQQITATITAGMRKLSGGSLALPDSSPAD